MIPEFPNFKGLQLDDRDHIEAITSKYPPYSDFNFVSMYSWDVDGNMQISRLNGNLIVRFTDYLDGSYFFSMIGENDLENSTRTLLEYSKKTHNKNTLRLVPMHTAEKLSHPDLSIEKDPNAYDYVYEVSHLANMHNWAQHSSGKNVRSFTRQYPNYVVKHECIENVEEGAYLDMFNRWAKNKNLSDAFTSNEYKALDRIFETNHYRLNAVSIYIDGFMIGFTIYEVVSPEYAISHFAKADTDYHRAVSDILNWEEAKILKDRGIKYFNWEQDLGIEGLRKSKQKYSPVHMFEKYVVHHEPRVDNYSLAP